MLDYACVCLRVGCFARLLASRALCLLLFRLFACMAMCPSTLPDDCDGLNMPNADLDDSGFAEPVNLGVRRAAERVGPWNSQCERFAQSIMLAARLGGGGNITFKFGGMVAEVEIKHSRAAEPELVQRTREMRLNALAMQEEKVEAAKKG